MPAVKRVNRSAVAARSAFTFLKSLGAIRDGLAVLALAPYLLGYVNWTVFGTSRGLDGLPLVDLRYYKSGVMPFLITAAVVLLWLSLQQGRQRLKAWFTRCGQAALKRRVRNCLVLIVSACGAVVVRQWLVAERDTVLLAYLALMGLTLVDLAWPGQRDMQWLGSLYSHFVPGVYGTVLLTVYCWVLFPVLPQTLGGGLPRCAQIDVRVEDLSRETLTEIHPGPWASATAQVIRSAPLAVYLAGADKILVQPPQLTTGVTGRYIIELPEEIVQAISWCD